ncbi:MAG: LPS assembly protein LptD [Planctomycetales bacterium]|nr:LPS assembly protein LptD [Planctomycetales bacterium]
MVNSILAVMFLAACSGLSVGAGADSAAGLVGQDLHVAAPTMTVCWQPVAAEWTQTMLLEGGVSVQIGDNLLTSRNAVVWLQPQGAEQAGFGTGQAWRARVYMEGDVSVQQGPKSKTTPVQHFMVEGAQALVTQFLVTGQVYATADTQTPITPDYLKDYDLYGRGLRAAEQIPSGPAVRAGARVPSPQEVIAHPENKPDETLPPSVAMAEQLRQSQEAADSQQPAAPVFPVHLSAVWEPVPRIQKTPMPDGQDVVTASGRFYLWQKRSEDYLIEFMADNLVVFFEKDQFVLEADAAGSGQLGAGPVRAVYLSGNIVMTEGNRTTRADEVYYDFIRQRAMVVNASMRVYDDNRGLPIYLRAQMLGRVSRDIFEARDIQLTSSEFYFPQISLNASKMVLLTGEALEQRRRLTEQKDVAVQYEGHLKDVTARYGSIPFFTWPDVVTNFARPDIPLSRLAIGNDSTFGTTIESRWYLARLLGIKDPAWADSRLAVDYFSDRGVGGGVENEYETDDSKGSLVGYVMTDRGEDDLGRTRKNIDPEEDTRGRFSFRHRQYLPDDWQLTLEAGWVSDRNFMESLYRHEFYTDKGQETLVHLKKIWDNQAFSILGKVRINDFETTTEELPSIEYHRTGQSFWDHRLTWYSDSQVARFRDRFDEDADEGPQDTSDFYTFAFTRNEVDLPLMWETVKLVPFVAGNYGFEDNYGYDRDINGQYVGSEDQVFLGETGMRASTMFWKEDPYYRSTFWDLKGMRHILTPYAETVLYEASDDAVDMRDAVHVGLLQRWQTHRGSEQNIRSLDWMRLDVETTWVDEDADDAIGPPRTYGPAGFVYNDPSIPLLLRRDENYYGLVRDTLNAEYVWRMSDTFSLLSDMNYDVNSGDIQQLDAGVSRFVFPDVSYYVGTRYLRPVIIAVDKNGDGTDDFYEKGSNSFVAAVTYRLSPRYVATFSQEYDFDFGKSIRSDLALVRQYHRLFYAVSFSLDESLDRSSVMFSVWPQGVDELAVGSRKYTALTGSRWDE